MKIVFVFAACAMFTATSVFAQSRPQGATAEEALDDADSRALERALVRSGGVLLAPWQKEIEPGLTYDHTRRSGLAIDGGTVVFRDVQRDTAFGSLGLRLGLPWTTQLEVSVPYGWQSVETVNGGFRSSTSDSGVGDIQVGLSKQLYADRDGRTGLIANATWQESSGSSNLASLTAPVGMGPMPSLGAGYSSLNLRLTGLTRLDPIVFVGSISHSFARDADVGGAQIAPGD